MLGDKSQSFVRPRYHHDMAGWVITEVAICDGRISMFFSARFGRRGSRGERKGDRRRVRSGKQTGRCVGFDTSSRMAVNANLSSDGDPDTRSRPPPFDPRKIEPRSRYETTTKGQTDRRLSRPIRAETIDRGAVSSANPSDARDASRPNNGDARGASRPNSGDARDASRPNSDDARDASPNDANGASTSLASTRVQHWAQRVGW
jgi:hypothetical protein